jgi:hypothetical protein
MSLEHAGQSQAEAGYLSKAVVMADLPCDEFPREDILMICAAPNNLEGDVESNRPPPSQVSNEGAVGGAHDVARLDWWPFFRVRAQEDLDKNGIFRRAPSAACLDQQVTQVGEQSSTADDQGGNPESCEPFNDDVSLNKRPMGRSDSDRATRWRRTCRSR